MELLELRHQPFGTYHHLWRDVQQLCLWVVDLFVCPVNLLPRGQARHCQCPDAQVPQAQNLVCDEGQ